MKTCTDCGEDYDETWDTPSVWPWPGSCRCSALTERDFEYAWIAGRVVRKLRENSRGRG